MGLLGWFTKKTPPTRAAAAPAPRPVRVGLPREEVTAPAELEPQDSAEQAFGGTVATGLIRYLQSCAHDMRSPGDKQYVSLLLRAVRNDGVEIPAMPNDIMEIQRLLASADTELADLARAVQRDPSIAAKFVSVANSPMYRGIREVSSVQEALARVGLNHGGMILLAIVSSSKLFKVNGYEAEAKWLHRHSLSTAIISQYLARHVGANEQSAFMGGLLHDLGRVFLLSTAHDVWRVSKGEATVSKETVRILNDHLHAGFSALTAQVWNFDASVVSALQHHEVSAEAGGRLVAMVPPEHEVLTQIVAVANLIDQYLEEPEHLPASARALIRDLGMGDVDEVLASAQDTAWNFLDNLGLDRVANPNRKPASEVSE